MILLVGGLKVLIRQSSLVHSEPGRIYKVFKDFTGSLQGAESGIDIQRTHNSDGLVWF